MAAYRAVITEAAYDNFPDLGPLDQRDAFGKAFVQTLNLRYESEGVKTFVLAHRLAKIAADLNGVDAVRIFHEKALSKEPGGSHTHWHQDQYFWPLESSQVTSLWMPLIDMDLDMGPIRFASGSHNDGYLGHYGISDESQSVFDTVIQEKGFPVWQQAMKAGDATCHNGWLIHGASPNQTNTMREAMIVAYYPDGTRVGELMNPSRVNDAKDYLGGRKTGDLADSELNTVVYQR